jgi:hypothetical protein
MLMADAKRSTRFCAVAGCENTLSKFNRAGVCMVHSHAPGLCRCPQCAGLTVTRAEPVAREGVRIVTVASHVPVSSGGVPRLRVSLPCEPWLRGGA